MARNLTRSRSGTRSSSASSSTRSLKSSQESSRFWYSSTFARSTVSGAAWVACGATVSVWASMVMSHCAVMDKVRHIVIFLLRHADAAAGSPDAERPLSERGEEQARDAGGALAALGVQLDACVSSPMVRAADTARL